MNQNNINKDILEKLSNKNLKLLRYKNELDIKIKKDYLKKNDTSLENKNNEENKDKNNKNREDDQDKKSVENKTNKNIEKNLSSEKKRITEIGYQNFDKYIKRPKSTKTQKIKIN